MTIVEEWKARLTGEQIADMNAAHRWHYWFHDFDGRAIGAGATHT